MIDAGLLVLRVAVGLILAAHGAQKLFGWFGGPRIAGMTGFMQSLGLRPARFWAIVVALGELAGGLLTAAGLLGPIGPALLAGDMLGAALLVHWAHGFWNQASGVEYPLTIAAAAVALALIGVGRWSLDRALGWNLHEPVIVAAALAVAFIAGVIAIATTGHLPRTTTAPASAS
jgi:putative oxidoreductase